MNTQDKVYMKKGRMSNKKNEGREREGQKQWSESQQIFDMGSQIFWHSFFCFNSRSKYVSAEFRVSLVFVNDSNEI